MVKVQKINVDNGIISIQQINNDDYICLTDMVNNQKGKSKLIEKWIINKNTVEFLGLWEELNNRNFNSPEFGGILKSAGTNRFYLSVKQWINKTNSIGIFANTGRNGGTYAHKDIAFEFASWINPLFKLYLIKEYQRLKEIENNKYNLEWNFKRVLSKNNYQIHTKAIKDYIVPKSTNKELEYASEADILNIVIFGCTAKKWREANPKRVLKGENIRDMASINELAILSNIESLNSTLIRKKISRKERYEILLKEAQYQKEVLDKVDYVNSIKKISDSTFIDEVSRKNGSLQNKNLKKEIDNPLLFG